MSSLQEPKEDNKPKSSTLLTKRSNLKLNNTSPKSNKKVNIVEDIYKSPSNSLIDNTNNDITEVSPLNQVTDSLESRDSFKGNSQASPRSFPDTHGQSRQMCRVPYCQYR